MDNGYKLLVHSRSFICQHIADQFYFTLSTYSPVLVLIRINSPSFTNKGTLTVAPVSTLAGFRVRVAVSPLTPGSEYVTRTTILSGSSTLIGCSVSVLTSTETSCASF